MKVGLVLSGGGARGISHIGVIKALTEMGINISQISGTSAGAIVGTLYSYGFTPDEILEHVVATSLFRAMRPAWTWTGLLSLEGLGTAITKLLPENNFDCLKIPMTIAATDIRQGKSVYFTEGELVPALLASCCVPAVFNPVEFNGGVYVDGGLMDNLPAKPIRGKCDLLIGSHCNYISNAFDIRNIRSVIERSLLIAINGNTTISKSMCDILIEPPDVGNYSGFDLKRAKNLFETGYRFVKENFTYEDFERKKEI
jgi:NTE family protein